MSEIKNRQEIEGRIVEMEERAADQRRVAERRVQEQREAERKAELRKVEIHKNQTSEQLRQTDSNMEFLEQLGKNGHGR